MHNLHQNLRDYLEAQHIEFKALSHGKASTCQESAQLRNEPLAIGGKTLLFRDKQSFYLFVLSAALNVDSNKVRKILGSQKLRFATPEELWELAGVEKGALPPFGRPLLPFDLYLDRSILNNDRIAFNAGVLDISFILKLEDYLKLVSPKVCDFAKA